MEKTCFKVFFSKIKEQEWLDKMGEDGYLLTKISDSKYHFVHSEEHKYKYSIEYLEFSPRSDDAVDYYKSLEENNITPIISSGNWVYLVATDSYFEKKVNVYKNNARYHLWKTIYLFFFAFTGAVVCGYQAFAAEYLPKIGQQGNGKIGLLEINESASGFLNTLKEWFNGILDALNDTYIKLLTNFFGESDAVLVLAVLIPIVIVLTVFFAMHLEQYVEYRRIIKKMNIKNSIVESEGEQNAEQAI